MSLVDANTGELLAGISPEDARTLTDRIKIAVEGTWDLIRQAYTSRAWAALGHPSWDDYCTREFGTSRLRLPREERSEVVASLRDSGLSIRAIASATGVNRETVRQEIAGDKKLSPAPDADHQPTPEPRPIVGTDGKTYTPPPKPETPPTPRRPSLVDAAERAGREFRNAVERLERITSDDRFAANRTQIAQHLRGHLAYGLEVCADIANDLDNNNP